MHGSAWLRLGVFLRKLRLKPCMDRLLGRLGLPKNLFRIFKGTKLMISCVFQKELILVRLVSSSFCTGRAHVFAYLGFWDGGGAPGILWEFLGIYLEVFLYKGQIWLKIEIFVSWDFCTALLHIFPEYCGDRLKGISGIFLEFMEQR